MSSDADDPTATQLALTQAFATAVGAGAGGVEGAVVGAALAPYLTELAGRALVEVRGHLLVSAGRMLASASTRAQLDPDDLVALALSKPGTDQLLADALLSAVATLDARKVEGLALAVANGLTGDEALVNESHLIVRALAELEGPHIRVLGLVVEQCSAAATVNRVDVLQMARARDSVDAIVATLERVGILEPSETHRWQAEAAQVQQVINNFANAMRSQQRQAGIGGGPPTQVPTPGRVNAVATEKRWRLTAFGRTCWQHLQDAAVPPA
jgi:hypothetical protein